MLKKFLFHSCFLFFLFIAHCSLFIVKAQDTINLIPINRDSTYDLRLTTYDLLLIDSIFKKRGEIYFKTFINSRVEINKLTRIISIDRVKKKIVFAYANKKEFTEFLKLKYKFTILTSPGKLRKPRMLKSIDEKKNDFWNYYPSYIVYVKLMHKFVNDYPALCKLDTIGKLSSGRMLLALKISANTNLNKAKPRFLYTSSIHGDEPLGYVLMLHLIDSLLSGYGNVSRITKLVDNIDIYINPLANPDGTYSGGDSTIYGATRYNINNVDLNRSYPNSVYGQNLDSNKWEPETKAFIDYASKIHFTMSANLHGGSELVNYPWDSWSRLAADDNWWQCVSQEFADTIHKYSIPGYFADPDINGGTGISNGYAWYDIYGSRQDYMNFYQHCRESTIEMSNDKIPFAGYLLTYWKYTNRSFFNYIEKSLQGIKGIVTDSSKGKPIFAKVFINGHDKDSSHVWSSLPDGDYHRLIYSGTYDLTFSATGYYSKTFKNINVSGVCDSATVLNVKLVSLTDNTNIINNSPEKFSIYPNPNDGVFNIKVSLPALTNQVFKIYNVLGKEVYSQSFTSNNGYNDFKINLIGVQEGIYFGRLFTDDKVMTTKFIITH